MNVIKSLAFFLLCVLLIIGILTIIIVIRTFTLESQHSHLPDCKPDDSDYIKLTDEVLKRFQNSLRFETVSYSRVKANLDVITQYTDYLISAYSFVHSSPIVTRHVIANYSILYTVKGTDPSLTPYMLCAHLDVVPADGSDWITDPFGGNVIDGYIYGRGTIDFKNGVNGLLEALEFGLSKGFVPKRSFFIALGHDEELGGRNGASAIASYVRSTLGIKRLEFVLDEGTVIVREAFKGMVKPFAIVGVTEKGSAFLQLSVTTETGHTSMPYGESSIGILAKAIHRLESTRHPSMLSSSSVEKEFFEALAPHAALPMRIVLSNVWLFSPLISWFVKRIPAVNSLIRTVTITTTFNAGIKDNVIPPYAAATINHRIHQTQSVQQVLDFDRKVIADDRVKMKVLSSMEPHPVSPHDDRSFGYNIVKASIQQVYSVIVVPGLMIGNTDTRAYLTLSSSIYRFSFTKANPEDLKRFHGINERISLKNYEEAINFYYHVMRNSDESSVKHLHHKHPEL